MQERVRRRVVVTGMGLVTPLGTGLDKTWKAICAGQSGVRRITRFDPTGYPCQIAGEVSDFEPADYIEKKEIKKMDSFIHYAVGASQQAADDAGLKITAENAERVGVYIGAGIGGLPAIEYYQKVLMEKGVDRISPFFIPMVIINLASGQVAIRLGAKGPNSCAVTACATGNHCIGDALRLIQHGEADVMVAGGTESTITPLAVGGFAAARALSRRNDDPARASRPFDRGRDGFVLSEGAGVLVLEELEHALARGAEPLAELIGYGATADASHITLPAPGGIGAVRAARRAIEKAGLSPDDIDHVNAHATSTPEGDKAELTAIRTILGERAASVPVTANKSMLGHTLGAAGALETIATIQTIRTGTVPPTINLADPDPAGEGMDLTPNTATRREVVTALSNSFGFGGQNTALILRRWDA